MLSYAVRKPAERLTDLLWVRRGGALSVNTAVTDYPDDISALLNSDIGPAYNLVKQLLRIFPIYFNEIGAEGELRDISTRIDELSYRNDSVVHFLRKQSHVEHAKIDRRGLRMAPD